MGSLLIGQHASSGMSAILKLSQHKGGHWPPLLCSTRAHEIYLLPMPKEELLLVTDLRLPRTDGLAEP